MNVQITLKSNVLEISDRIAEIHNIRDWINELVYWDEDMYQIRFHSSGEKMIVWFEEEQHATAFALRWV